MSHAEAMSGELRKRKRTPVAKQQRQGGYRALDGFTEKQREHHRGIPTPPPPVEQVEARRAQRKGNARARARHGRPRGR